MALSTEDAAWLAQLRAARQKLIAGGQVGSVSSGGRSISFSLMSADKALEVIDAEIERLEAADASPDGKTRRRGALGFRY